MKLDYNSESRDIPGSYCHPKDRKEVKTKLELAVSRLYLVACVTHLILHCRWEQFTDAVIRELNKGNRRLVFMLWGKPSQVLFLNMSYITPAGVNLSNDVFRTLR